MLTVDVRNVHQAIPEACHRMKLMGVRRGSRNGPVKMLPLPLTTTYRRPCERMETWPERDSNPFFHIMEAIWMLYGGNDVKFPSIFSSTIHQFSDDGAKFNGAYGYRWRKWFGYDQLDEIITGLRNNPNCRRQVLGMWDPEADLGNIHTKDVPCNTIAFLQVNTDGNLDLMVCNRSNDLVWGAYGANAVHFSVLLEYMAAMIERGVGHYYQVSMNTHVYERHFELVDTMAEEIVNPPADRLCPYSVGAISPTPIVSKNMEVWHRDLERFMKKSSFDFETDVFYMLDVMRESYLIFREKDNPDRHDEALEEIRKLPKASDWRFACELWLLRRQERARQRKTQ